MAIWNGGKGEACAFLCQKKDNCASITWFGTWDLELRPCVVEAWERLATEFTRSNIRVEKQRLRDDVISSHGDAIYQLDLPCGVIDPVSLWQIQKEGTDQTESSVVPLLPTYISCHVVTVPTVNSLCYLPAVGKYVN